MFEWLRKRRDAANKREWERRQEESRLEREKFDALRPTVGKVKARLREFRPDSIMVVTSRSLFSYERHDYQPADEFLVKAFHPLRTLRPDEPGYLPGVHNKVRDTSQDRRVIIRIGRRDEVMLGDRPFPWRKDRKKPITVADILAALETLDDNLRLVDSSHEDAVWTEDARNFVSDEFYVTRDAKPGDDLYVEGVKNRVPDTPLRASLWVNSTDFSQYHWMD